MAMTPAQKRAFHQWKGRIEILSDRIKTAQANLGYATRQAAKQNDVVRRLNAYALQGDVEAKRELHDEREHLMELRAEQTRLQEKYDDLVDQRQSEQEKGAARFELDNVA